MPTVVFERIGCTVGLVFRIVIFPPVLCESAAPFFDVAVIGALTFRLLYIEGQALLDLFKECAVSSGLNETLIRDISATFFRISFPEGSNSCLSREYLSFFETECLCTFVI